MSPVTFCESCGRKVGPDARFCAGCGRPFDGADPSETASDKQVAATAGGVGGEREVAAFGPVVLQSVGELLVCVLTAGIAWVCLWASRSHTRYRLTSERLEIRTGRFTHTSRTVDLFRVQDLEIQEPFFLRLRGAGHLVIRSQDAGEPEVVLRAVPGVRALHETIRSLMAAERRRLHVKIVEESR
ncbi:MAG: PH domain-containing protein [Planctomycetes bacterium]|nr:PH domain-containing protein [Planctomycetota bacterium]